MNLYTHAKSFPLCFLLRSLFSGTVPTIKENFETKEEKVYSSDKGGSRRQFQTLMWSVMSFLVFSGSLTRRASCACV